LSSRSPLASSSTRSGLWGGLFSWLDAAPHPDAVFEISTQHVAAVVWRDGRLSADGLAWETLPAGAVAPSAVELNLADPSAVSAAVERVVNRLRVRGHSVALLLPDPAVRVFLLPFESFPRNAEEAVPLLRWRLKKSVPFDVEDTNICYTLQPSRTAGVEVLAGIARKKTVQQYEHVLEEAGLRVGVVLGSTLAVLPMLDQDRPTLLARVSGATLAVAVVRGDVLCVFRTTELSTPLDALEPAALAEELFPAIAFYQDTWQETVQQVRLSGFAARGQEFRSALETELGCSVGLLAASAQVQGGLAPETRALLDRQFDALVGWMMNRGA
jgi:Tfp pilus assembly PilM family ATPase